MHFQNWERYHHFVSAVLLNDDYKQFDFSSSFDLATMFGSQFENATFTH